MVNEVTESNIRTNVFKSTYSLISDNKITNSNVLAGFSSDTVKFPCYVINPALVKASRVTKGNNVYSYTITIEIELWATASQLKSKIDEMKDNIQATIMNNLDYLNGQNLTLGEDWFDDSNVETLEFDQVKYHTGAVSLRFQLE